MESEGDKENQRLVDIDESEFVTPDTKIFAEKIPDDPILASPVICSQSSVASSNATAGTSADESDYEELETEEVGEGGNKRRVTCRKEKSLGLLCQRFIEAMKEETAKKDCNQVHLESVATKMKVEKRRIYDIVNVMEALDAMSKLNKSFYAWHGLNNLPKLMSDLQRESIEENLPSKIIQVEQAMCSFTDLSPGSKRKDLVGSMLDPALLSGASPVTSSPLDSPFSTKSFRILTPTSVHSPSTSQSTRDPRGTKNSLAMLCRRFIMVLLANPQDRRRVSLDVASTVLIKDTDTEGFGPPSRGRCRRLYDIANVLVAMGIIKKVHYLFGTKKIPLFIYSGPEPDETATLSDDKLEEMMVLPRKAIDDVIREKKTFGKRSKSEACLDDVMRQQRAGKMSRIGSPHDSPATAAWKMMELANAAEKERLLMALNSPNSRKRLTQSTSNLVLPPSSSHGWSPSTAGHSIPTSPLAVGAGQFVPMRAQPFAFYRTLSDLSTIGGGGHSSSSSYARSPRSTLQPVLSPLNRMQVAAFNQAVMQAATAAAAAGAAHNQQQQHSSPRAATRIVLSPLQPSITSPRNAGAAAKPHKTPTFSMKALLRSPALKQERVRTTLSSDTPEKEKVRIGTLEHRATSRFAIVKKEPGTEERRRAFGLSNAVNTQGHL